MKQRSALRPAIAVILVLGACAPAVGAAPVALSPAFAGEYAPGNGVDASFLKVDNTWHSSSVLWSQVGGASQNCTGAAVGTCGWGTGLWGIADWQKANQALPPNGMLERNSWKGRVSSISFGDCDFNRVYRTTGDKADLAPLFSQTCPPTAADGWTTEQENWTSSFGGYIRISTPGRYNFGVLSDDGFFFRLRGADRTLDLSRDYLNPPDRIVGFDDYLILAAGLYSFELGAFDRLQTGVVELSWMREREGWSIVPTANLVATPVTEPASWALTLAALAAVGAAARRRRANAR